MGGFCLAFAKEGFQVIWANEKDRFAVETCRQNFPNTAVHHKPIEELSVVGDDLPPVDVLTAGFRCQPFSVAGSKLGFSDERGRTFFEIMRLIAEFGKDRPKITVGSWSLIASCERRISAWRKIPNLSGIQA
jgi:DNA (cytosine-5)-methyltransferase 1